MDGAETTGKALKRRGLIAGAAALVATLAARGAGGRVAANGPIVAPGNNSEAGAGTTLSYTGGSSAAARPSSWTTAGRLRWQ